MECVTENLFPAWPLQLSDIAAWPPFKRKPEALPSVVAGVPSLQRGLVWKPGQIELLWDSLLRGFPIGAFVVCKKLSAMNTRNVEHNDRFVTHHLLDGQQRAQAIRLGFEDPFEDVCCSPRQILWIDLNPDRLGETRQFLFRVTTRAHPWGYAENDAATPVGIARIRTSLEKCGADVGNDGIRKRPEPNRCWPIVANIPIPFAWLAGSPIENLYDMKNALKLRCEEIQEPHRDWRRTAIEFLDSDASNAPLDGIRAGLRRGRKTRVLCLEVPWESLTAPTKRELGVTGEENVSNVENLFQRLNGGGTRLDGDDLSYSMIKAYWPHLETPIRELADHRRLPEARLVTLAARLPFRANTETPGVSNQRKITRTVSVSDIRRLAQDGSDEHKEIFSSFLEKDTSYALKAVLSQVHLWLAPVDGCQSGLPPVLQTSIARDSRDVYALLLWLAQRFLVTDRSSGVDIAKPIQGLATFIHWFALDKRRAVEAVMSCLGGDKDRLSRDRFRGVLVRARGTDDGRRAFVMPPSVADFRAGLQSKDGYPPDTWGFSESISSMTEDFRSFANKIFTQREILLYAQRRYLFERFGDYDPAIEETWAQHNRPWDFDHIVPMGCIHYHEFPFKPVLKEWALSIANERVWPMEDNRSDKDKSPYDKLWKTPEIWESESCDSS